MFNLMRADIYRILRGKGMYICLLLITLSLCFSAFLRSPGHLGLNMDISTSGTNLEEMESIKSFDDAMDVIRDSEEHPVDADIMSVGGNLYFFFIFAVFVVFCTDLSSHTAKNIISTGISRTTYYTSKLCLSLVIGTFFILFHSYGGYIINLLFNGSGYSSSILDITVIMIRQLPVFYGMISVLVMLSAIIQKTARFTAVTILLLMGVQLIVMALSAIFKFNAADVLQYEFEGMLRSLAVVGPIATGKLITTTAAGIIMLIISTVVGQSYFKKCTIK